MMRLSNEMSTLVFIYNSFNDPLFQNLVLTYIKTLAKKGNYVFYVITFEQDNYRITENEKRKVIKDLNRLGIYWYPLNYHTGHFLLLKKLYDFMAALLLVSKIRLVKNTKVIFSFGNIAASFSIIFSIILSMRMIVYSYEPHSFFLAELGLWSKRSLKYQLLKAIEKFAGIHGDYILTGTKHMVNELRKWGAKGNVFCAPTGVDESEFSFRNEGRIKVRKRFALNDRDVLIYMGKFGGLYYKEEVAELCKLLFDLRPKLFFLIVTSNKHEEVNYFFKNAGLDGEHYAITGGLSYDEVKDYLSAADIGLSAVPPTPSQKFRSPTKVGEYLLCGLPYITCKGISEDDVYATENNVGVVLENFNREHVIKNIENIDVLLSEEKESLRYRCRNVGIEYRGKANVDKLLAKIFNEIFTHQKS